MKLPVSLRQHLRKKPRVYIFPTRMGGYFNGLIFLMFLLSVSYNNNLLLIFTLFLFGLNLIWVIQTHFHLHALKLQSVSIQDGHAGENVLTEVHWKKSPDGPCRWEITLESNDKAFPLTAVTSDTLVTKGCLNLPTRGIWNFSFIKVKSIMPFGLYMTWIYFPVNARTYAFPSRLKDLPVFNRERGFLEGDDSTSIKGPHDVWNLAPYQGDESRKISWKHYAKSGELVIREGEELSKLLVHFKVGPLIPEKEFVLSKMATQMLHCAQNDILFTLETPTFRSDARSSGRHLIDCLRELATC